MHIEVQVALNFVISYLYNKLPRRRVNIFGEELEKAMKDKFAGHWYPDKPFRGSAYRCLKTGDPVDAVLDRAARESGIPIQDILENLPEELAVWVDPGEVSYRIGEKGAVKILFSDTGDVQEESSADREVTKTFNPEAQCFRPIEAAGTMNLAPKCTSPFSNNQSLNTLGSIPATSSAHSSPAPTPFKGSPSPAQTSFLPRSTAPLTFTTATFAQTKFGSTKLKTSSKRANRMSPTEFSNYIKQRALQQQVHHHPPPAQASPSGRALSPHPGPDFYFQNQLQTPFPQQFGPSAWEPLGPFMPPAAQTTANIPPQGQTPSAVEKQVLEGLNSFGLGTPYSGSQYQHLLVAN